MTGRTRVRATVDIGTIFGVDGEDHELREGEIVTLQTANVEPLLAKDGAVPVDEVAAEARAVAGPERPEVRSVPMVSAEFAD